MTAARKARSPKRAAAAPPETPARWRRRAHARPDELLDAALDEFIVNGFDAARIEDIAKRAGLSKGTVYLYFKSKEDLLRALITREAAPVAARVAFLAQAPGEPIEMLRAIARTVGGAMANPRLMAIPRLVISVADRFPDLREFYRDQVAVQAKSAIEGLIRKGVATGQFRKVDPHVGARALIGPILFEALWAHVLKGPSKIGTSTWIETHFDLVLSGLEAR
jgi:AcrR family transcriptional regulator